MIVAAAESWALGWTAIAGLATLVLALLTGWLAWSTRELARETNQDIRSQWRPIMVVSGRGNENVRIADMKDARVESLRSDNPLVEIDVSLWNRGRGPALNCVATIRATESAFASEYITNRISVLSVDAKVDLLLTGVMKDDKALSSGENFSEVLDLVYEDVSGNVYETTAALLGGSPSYDRRRSVFTTNLGASETKVRPVGASRVNRA
jgi:hypothetical protein